MLRENLKDAADILSNILNQPLEVPGAAANISLLKAVLNFDAAQAEHSDLSKILRALTEHPTPAQTLIQELDLLSRDLIT